MGYRNGGQYTQPKCRKTKDGIHEIQFDYTKPEFEDDCVRLDGVCIYCNLEFQKTYQQTEGLSAIAKSTREVFDFNKHYVEAFGIPVLADGTIYKTKEAGRQT